jgi:hypothetical protein
MVMENLRIVFIQKLLQVSAEKSVKTLDVLRGLRTDR